MINLKFKLLFLLNILSFINVLNSEQQLDLNNYEKLTKDEKKIAKLNNKIIAINDFDYCLGSPNPIDFYHVFKKTYYFGLYSSYCIIDNKYNLHYNIHTKKYYITNKLDKEDYKLDCGLKSCKWYKFKTQSSNTTSNESNLASDENNIITNSTEDSQQFQPNND